MWHKRLQNVAGVCHGTFQWRWRPSLASCSQMCSISDLKVGNDVEVRSLEFLTSQSNEFRKWSEWIESPFDCCQFIDDEGIGELSARAPQTGRAFECFPMPSALRMNRWTSSLRPGAANVLDWGQKWFLMFVNDMDVGLNFKVSQDFQRQKKPSWKSHWDEGIGWSQNQAPPSPKALRLEFPKPPEEVPGGLQTFFFESWNR